MTSTYRVIRDNALARELKSLHEGTCQIIGCAAELRLANGTLYAEAHHLHPLGSGGPDRRENMIVVYPNHHALLDYAAMLLDASRIRTHPKHPVGRAYIDHHNTRVARSHAQG